MSNIFFPSFFFFHLLVFITFNRNPRQEHIQHLLFCFYLQLLSLSISGFSLLFDIYQHIFTKLYILFYLIFYCSWLSNLFHEHNKYLYMYCLYYFVNNKKKNWARHEFCTGMGTCCTNVGYSVYIHPMSLPFSPFIISGL